MIPALLAAQFIPARGPKVVRRLFSLPAMSFVVASGAPGSTDRSLVEKALNDRRGAFIRGDRISRPAPLERILLAADGLDHGCTRVAVDSQHGSRPSWARTRTMKIFHCGRCDRLVFFENHLRELRTQLAYLPDRRDGHLDPGGRGEAGLGLGRRAAVSPVPQLHASTTSATGPCRPTTRTYCLVVPADPGHPRPGRRGATEAWHKLEIAKRRLVYTLARARAALVEQGRGSRARPGVRVPGRSADPRQRPVHDRARRRRHHHQHRRGRRCRRENGAPAAATSRIARCSATSATRSATTTGTADRRHRGTIAIPRAVRRRARGLRPGALQRHYDSGPPADWQQRFVSAYASDAPVGRLGRDLGALPAHDRHAGDGARLRRLAAPAPRRTSRRCRVLPPRRLATCAPFDRLIEGWFPLTYVLNNLNRGMGPRDA